MTVNGVAMVRGLCDYNMSSWGYWYVTVNGVAMVQVCVTIICRAESTGT